MEQEADMLIKQADDVSALLAALEQRAQGSDRQAQQAARELAIRRAGLKGEQQARYLIDFDFAASQNWAVIHDLRLQHQGRVAQIDHLLINRWLDVYVLETKHFHAGIKITEHGEFLQWNAYRRNFEGIASPLEQNQRHISVLEQVMLQLPLPERLGLRIRPGFHSLVLVSANARIDRHRRFDSTQVIKADQLKKRIWRDIDEENPLYGLLRTAAKMVSGQTIAELARQLAACHQPSSQPSSVQPAAATSPAARRGRIEPHFAAPATPPPLPAAVATHTGATTSTAAAHPAGDTSAALGCRNCHSPVGQVLYGKYGYYFKCRGCGGNTAIRLSCAPGHQPRLRKSGPHFHRDCPQCGSSERIFSNEPGT